MADSTGSTGEDTGLSPELRRLLESIQKQQTAHEERIQAMLSAHVASPGTRRTHATRTTRMTQLTDSSRPTQNSRTTQNRRTCAVRTTQQPCPRSGSIEIRTADDAAAWSVGEQDARRPKAQQDRGMLRDDGKPSTTIVSSFGSGVALGPQVA